MTVVHPSAETIGALLSEIERELRAYREGRRVLNAEHVRLLQRQRAWLERKKKEATAV